MRDELPDPDREAGRRARGEYQTALTLDDIDEWVRAFPEDGTGELEVEATGQMASGASAAATAEDAAADAAAADAAADDAADAAAAAAAASADDASEERAAEDAEERPMSQADIDEWLGAQTGDVDQSVLEAMRGIADQAAMRVPAARAAAVPPAPGRSADQGEAGLRWTASSCTSGIEAWGRWSQTERDITLELPVADETRGKQVRCEVSAGALEVRVGDELVFAAELAQQVRPTDLEWVLDTLCDGRKVVCIELPKRGDSSGPLFHSVRAGGEDVAAHQLALS